MNSSNKVVLAGEYPRTVRLKDEQAAAIGKLLRPPGARHPWPDEIAAHWGKGGQTALIKVQPWLVVEVAADSALQAGQYRHPLRLVRFRAELQPEDVPTLPGTAAEE